MSAVNSLDEIRDAMCKLQEAWIDTVQTLAESEHCDDDIQRQVHDLGDGLCQLADRINCLCWPECFRGDALTA